VPGYLPFDADEPQSFEERVVRALGRIADRIPGWTPTPDTTRLDVAVVEETLREVDDQFAILREVARDVIFRAVGVELHGIPMLPGRPVTGDVVLRAASTDGFTVPAGTMIGWSAVGGEAVAFRTVADVTIQPGQLDSPPVQVVAEEQGTVGNDLPVGPVQIVDALAFLESARAVTVSAGGADAETAADYADRLADSLQTLRRAGTFAADFAILARDVPGVHRALGIDNYNPVTNTDGVAELAVAAVDIAGQPLTAAVKAELQTLFTETRETNFIVRLFDPTYTAVNIDFVVVADPGSDLTVVGDAAAAALEALVDPALYGGGGERPPAWRLQPTLRYLRAVTVLGTVPGVAEVVDLTLNGARVDVALAGRAPLPAATSVVTGTVSA
jgi:hypothetical protein